MPRFLARMLALPACLLSAMVAVGAPKVAAEYLHLARFDVLDRYGWSAPVVAFSFLAPADWRLEGGIIWNNPWQCRPHMVQTHVRIASPDGRFAFEMFPQLYWEWMEDPLFQLLRQQELAAGAKRCPASELMGAEALLTQYLVPEVRPGARVIAVVAAPEVARAAEIRTRQSPEGAGLRLAVDAMRVTLALPDGRQEWVTATAFTRVTQNYSPTASQAGLKVPMDFYGMGANEIFAFSAPAGMLEQAAPIFSIILSSIRINPVWVQALLDHYAALDRIDVIGAAQRAAIWRKAQSDIGQIIAGSWQQRQDSQDRVAGLWSQTILDTATYADPSGGYVAELPSGYQGVWSNGGGDFLLSTDVGFDPNRDLNAGSWTALEQQN